MVASMLVVFHPLSLDVTVHHVAGTPPRAAHEAARGVKGMRLLSTFVDGWGRLVSTGIAHGAR